MHEALDLYFTAFGDYDVDQYGGLRDTWEDPFRSLRQEVATLAQANYNDWGLQPNIGANLDDYIGSPNSAATGEQVKAAMEKALNQFLLPANDFRVDIFPLDQNTLGIMVTVQIGSDNGEIQVLSLPIVFNLGLGISVA